MFLLAFLILGGVSWAIARLERAVGSPRVAIA
jgi:hypothetical protein